MYLSPAFSPRDPGELEFLRSVNPKTGFSLFWIDIVRPLLEHCGARHLVEIGAGEGEHTRLLLRYCEEVGGHLTVVEPAVPPELRRLLEGAPRARLCAARSETVIPALDQAVDAVLLEGDLNYAVVRGDLERIADLAEKRGVVFPLVFVKNTSWPYARRDMYYAPEAIPQAARQPFAKGGLSPRSPGQVSGMINAEFAHALEEGGPRNGVLTAVEDFLGEAGPGLHLWTLPMNHGLGIIYRKPSPAAAFVEEHLQLSPTLRRFLETAEIARLNGVLARLQAGSGLSWPTRLRRRCKRLLSWSRQGLGLP